MPTRNSTKTELLDQAGYFTVPGAHLYTVLHQVEDPVARLLLVGPFAPERHYAYHSLVCWARYLAARGVEVLRYDYRGVGESTGVFEEMSFEHWGEDVHLLIGWLANRSPRVPLVLHGLELGAVLAGRSFQEGVGDALLLWSPPADANRVLRSVLLRWAGLEQLWESSDNRKTAAEYIRLMEQGSFVCVHGYQWSSRLWRDSFQFDLPAAMTDGTSSRDESKRPFKSVLFGKGATSPAIPYARFPEVIDHSSLYSCNYNWLAEALALPTGGRDEGHD